MSSDRWATFDCYGTLVNWNAGIRTELEWLIAGVLLITSGATLVIARIEWRRTAAAQS